MGPTGVWTARNTADDAITLRSEIVRSMIAAALGGSVDVATHEFVLHDSNGTVSLGLTGVWRDEYWSAFAVAM